MVNRTKDEWTRLFKRLGASSPELLADCEVKENLGNLTQLAFLKQAFLGLPDNNRIENLIKHRGKQESSRSLESAYERVAAAGVSKEDILALMREACRDYLWHITYILDDNSIEDDELKGLVHWGLWEESEDFEPIRRIGCISDNADLIDPDNKDG